MELKNKLYSAGYKISDTLESAINDTFNRYKINTKLKQVHFLAQIIHESQGLTRTEESLNYSDGRLLDIFPKYFNSTTAKQYQRNSTAIGSRVYANRMGNGSEDSMDGYTYRGRGYIMNTGKSQYALLSKEFGVDFINFPNKLKELPYAMLSAGFYWYNNNLNILAEQDKVKEITKKINNGYNGLEDRIAILDKLKKVF